MKILVILLVSFSSLLFAQNPNQILKEVTNKYKKNINYYIEFDYELNNPKTNVKQKEKGNIYTAKKKYNLSLMDIQQIYNGKKLYTIDKETQEVVITKPKPNSDDLLTPTKVLNMYQKGFDLSLDKKKKIRGKSVQYIKLTPQKSSDVKYYLVGINTKDNTLYQYQEVNKENTTTTLTVTKYLEDLIIPKSIFKFNAKSFQKKGYFITE